MQGRPCIDLSGACAGQASLFSLSYDNAVYQMLSKGGPRILENQARALHLCLHPMLCCCMLLSCKQALAA